MSPRTAVRRGARGPRRARPRPPRGTTAGCLVALLVVSGAGCGGGPYVPPLCVEPPLALGEMPDLDMLIGDTVETSLADHFGHPCGGDDELSYTASSADSAVTVSISETDDLTTVAIAAADSVRVNVTATDTADRVAAHVYYVSAEQPNRAPEVGRRIRDVTVYPQWFIEVGDISGYFTDPDGDVLLFHQPPESADSTIAMASVFGDGSRFDVSAGCRAAPPRPGPRERRARAAGARHPYPANRPGVLREPRCEGHRDGRLGRAPPFRLPSGPWMISREHREGSTGC